MQQLVPFFNSRLRSNAEWRSQTLANIFVKRYEILMDPFHNIKRLNLYRFDGSPMHPMFLAYKVPQILPTEDLHPSSTVAASQGKPTGQSSKAKRDIAPQKVRQPPGWQPLSKTTTRMMDPDTWWWMGLGMTGFGSFLYFYI